jgi:hypothetical protein
VEFGKISEEREETPFDVRFEPAGRCAERIEQKPSLFL